MNANKKRLADYPDPDSGYPDAGYSDADPDAT